MSASETQRSEQAKLASRLPKPFTEGLEEASTKLQTYFAVRIGNPPKIGDYQYKPMSIKANTDELFGLIPTGERNRAFARAGSAKVEQQHIDRFGECQGTVTLAELLKKVELGIYNISTQGTELHFTPNKEKFRRGAFENPDTVANTTFVINLDRNITGLTPSKEEHLDVPTKPAWWKEDTFGNFNQAVQLLRPIDAIYPDSTAPEPYMCLGKPLMCGDIDLHSLVCQTLSFVNQDTDRFKGAHDKINLNDSESISQYRETFNAIITEMNHVAFPNSPESEFTTQQILGLRIEGIATPYEAAAIYMLNKIVGIKFNIEDIQLILHGADNNNPYNPSAIGLLLHAIPGKGSFFTRNENELVQLALTENFLKNYPITIHPKWNMQIWAPVVDARLKIEQEMTNKGQKIPQLLSKEVMDAYDKFKNPGIFSTTWNAIKQTWNGINPIAGTLHDANKAPESQGSNHSVSTKDMFSQLGPITPRLNLELETPRTVSDKLNTQSSSLQNSNSPIDKKQIVENSSDSGNIIKDDTDEPPAHLRMK